METLISFIQVSQIASAFIVLFAVIDVLGATPIIIDLKTKGRPVNALHATLISGALLVGFFFAGDAMLRLFSVDISSFAVAGSLVIFLMALEMILDIEIFKNIGPIKEATLVPVVFPLIAGAGSFTTLLSLRAEYASVSTDTIDNWCAAGLIEKSKLNDSRPGAVLILRASLEKFLRSRVVRKKRIRQDLAPSIKGGYRVNRSKD